MLCESHKFFLKRAWAEGLERWGMSAIPATWEVEEGESQSEASKGQKLETYLRNSKKGMDWGQRSSGSVLA
jgi:hypothetical protein